MTTPTVKHDVLGLSRAQWQSLLTELGEKPFRAAQIMKWLHHRSVDDFEAMTDISKQMRAYLVKHAEIAEPLSSARKYRKTARLSGCWKLDPEAPSRLYLFQRAVAAPCVCHPKSDACSTARSAPQESKVLTQTSLLVRLWVKCEWPNVASQSEFQAEIALSLTWC